MNSDNTLKWRFDISTFRLIGRDLITDRVTALFELVKNSYDANAENVRIEFFNVSAGKANPSILIRDDGYGMSFEDIRDKWMVIGTSSKRKHPYSPEPYKRKCVGEKGIGRFAVDKLGDKVSIITKKQDGKKWLKVDIDWEQYYNEMNSDRDIKLFTDIENTYTYIENYNCISKAGTELLISAIREPWTKEEIQHLIHEISKIVSPFDNINQNFNVTVVAPEFDIEDECIRTLENFSLATLSLSIDFNPETNQQEFLIYDKEKEDFTYGYTPIKSFGGIKMKIYFFDESARRKYRKEFPNNTIDGFKIYRDGIITTPFAETNVDADFKRDILGIDKRLWQDIFNRVSTREFLGIISISKQENPQIIDATNRQDFVDNKEYKEFKEFIISQLTAIEIYKTEIRKRKKSNTQEDLEFASENINSLLSALKSIIEDKPEIKDSVAPLIKQINKTNKTVKTAIREHKKGLEEFTRKENIYMSIMSLQQFAMNVTHAVRTMLNQIRDRIEFFYLYYPNPKEEELFKLYAREMFKQFKHLNKVIDYMLSYSQSNIAPEELNLKQVFDEIIINYKNIFDKEKILLQTSFPNEIILNANKQFFRDILQNILDNSIKAMKETPQKVIKCSYEILNDSLIILVSDTGVGIPKEKREQVFALFYTTTEQQGGGGLGLYIVKTRVEALKGKISIIDSEFGSIGTTIKIIIPFKSK